MGVVPFALSTITLAFFSSVKVSKSCILGKIILDLSGSFLPDFSFFYSFFFIFILLECHDIMLCHLGMTCHDYDVISCSPDHSSSSLMYFDQVSLFLQRI